MGPGPLDSPAEYLIEVTIIVNVTVSRNHPQRSYQGNSLKHGLVGVKLLPLMVRVTIKYLFFKSSFNHQNQEKELSSRLIQYWTNFIYTGWEYLLVDRHHICH